MNKLKKIISLLTALALTAAVTVTAYAVSLYYDGDYTYADVDRYHVSLYDYTGESDTLAVPATFFDKDVSEIYEYAFEGSTQFTRLDFSQNGNRISVIGTKAFSECTSLSGTLILPSSLRTLGFAAFQGCTGINKLFFNVGIREISEQSFNRCSGLSEVHLPTGLESIDRLAFGICGNLEKVYIPDSVTFIHEYAFTGDDPVFYVNEGSYAQEYAERKGFDCVVTGADEPPTEPVTDEPTEPQTDAPAATYLLGDTDHDGAITVLDATKIQKCLVVLVVDEDGWIHMAGSIDGLPLNVTHATYIQKYLARIPIAYPVGEERPIPTE